MKPESAAAKYVLPPAVYSPQLLEAVVYDLEVYLDWYRQSKVKKQVGATPDPEPTHSAETVVVIEAWLAGKPPTLESLEELIETLKNLELPQIHVMLAALPNRAQRELLVNWFRNNTTPQLLVSFVADRNLGGGVVVRTPNHVYDYTWKQQLVAGRDKLAGIIKSV
ncbi:MAG: atpH [Candidatus Saccharibacteria bacterium]|nr:atpH [Candidatus Saccharibacteria bacterium]